ncbi:hypothetical protein EXE30_01955 [Acinetobacter halotolerans]|uniref:Uncharacterized protein n=1 Tax=Acinetobacter halotolerans TaxID=1752076 RepID=A0A4V2DBE6_9GAMM|nr:hypothetical protein EXE30_01955 [Acinetobacter halotolerans]
MLSVKQYLAEKLSTLKYRAVYNKTVLKGKTLSIPCKLYYVSFRSLIAAIIFESRNDSFKPPNE